MALSKDTPQKVLGGHYIDYPMVASATIYEGSMVGDNASGYARALIAGDPFLGIAQKGCVETTAAAGGQYVRCRVGTWRQEYALAGALTDIGKIVYASDDGTLTLTAGTNTPVGRVVRYVSATLMEIEFTTCRAINYLVATANDLEIKSNDDLTLSAGKLAADKVILRAFDIDATAYVNLITCASHATVPSVTIGASAADTLAFFGHTGGTQCAHIADATTDTSTTTLITKVNAIYTVLETYGLVATA